MENELIPISIEEAVKRNPHLITRWAKEKVVVPTDGIFRNLNKGVDYRFYKCPHFEEDTRLCALHDTDRKPPMCVGYPLHGATEPTKVKLAHPKCGYYDDTRVIDDFDWGDDG